MSLSFQPGFSCAESVAESVLASPECTPELIQASFPPKPQTITTSGLRSLADRARERRYAGLAHQQGGLAAVLEEDGKGQVHSVRSSPPRVRPHRRTTLPALRLPSPSNNIRAYDRGHPSVPHSASLPPSPPDSPSVYNWTLPSPGIVSPLSAYSHLTPSSLSRAPWTEIVFPRDLAAENGRTSPDYSDGDDTSEEGACTTPTSMTTFGSVQDKDTTGGYVALVIPKMEVLPVPQRRAPLPPTVVLNGKSLPSPTGSQRGPFAGVHAAGGRRRSSLPTLEQITARMAAKEGGKPHIVRRSTAPNAASITSAGTPTSAGTTTSRLPSFLLARGANKKSTEENVQPAPAVNVVVDKPAFEVPVFTVTPPQERGEGGRKVLAVLNRRSSGGAPKIAAAQVPNQLWV